ncbi:MAG TPA: methionine--tRNA ligase [Tepidisphaeraceae bacterium]|nr:methionine--tRNA ligase [Tepidisphaeraceae bacterium]
MSNRFYITTPIYYPNGEPHLGHVYTTLCADTIARYHRLAGDDTFFLTGTDEHGLKMTKEAAEQGIEPSALADRYSSTFENLWKEFHVTNDDFIRTTQPRHKASVQRIVEQMLAKGDIYLGSYEGWYDVGQEEFVTETEAKAAEFKSKVSGKPLTRQSEKSYFFRLSKYVDRVLQHIESHPQFIQPDSRRNEVVSKLKIGVADLSISRATLKWGVPMPNDPEHVVYVWIDALSNYITALGYGTADDGRCKKYWPANVHLIGKEIMWFHTVYWPAMLFSLELPLPTTVFAHGWWTSDGRKMSKSMGNFIDLAKLREVSAKYGLDALRYYLLRAAPFGSDLDWSEKEFNAAYFELSKKLGNCLNRATNMTGRYRQNVVPAAGELQEIDRAVVAQIEALPSKLADAYARYALQDCALLPIEVVRAIDGYIEATAPFKMAKDPAQSARLDTVLNMLVRGMHAVLVSLLPILPEKAVDGLKQLGVDAQGRSLAELFAAAPSAGAKLGEGHALFPAIES